MMTREAKTNDTADPELEMSSGLASVVEGELLSYQLCPVITITGSMSRTSHLTTLKCRMLTSWLFYCHTMTCSDMWGHVEETQRDTERHLDSERERECARPEESEQNTVDWSDRDQLWTSMEFTDNTLYDYYAGDELLPRQVRPELNKNNIKYFILFLLQSFESGADISLFLGVFITIVPKVKIFLLKRNKQRPF